jgi:hypothetical protein
MVAGPHVRRKTGNLAVAAGGPVLELAIGTGRVALPLAARGLAIEGVEGSPEMVTKPTLTTSTATSNSWCARSPRIR